MSNGAPGPGWWQASDGRWYAPDQHPDPAHRSRYGPQPPTPSGPPAQDAHQVATPSPPPSLPAPAPSTPAPKRRFLLVGAIVVVVVAVSAAGIALLLRDDGDPDPDPDPAQPGPDLVAVKADELGDDPFATAVDITVVPGISTDLRPVVMETDPRSGTGVLDATEPGAFGGLPTEVICDPEGLADALELDPERAAVWSSVFEPPAGDVRSFLLGLTPVVLTADTWVTDHGYDGSGVVKGQAVLEARSSVLIDATGSPRVRCLNGNPLSAPDLSSGVRPDELVGDTWPGFVADDVVRVAPSGEDVTSFTVVDVETGDLFEQPVGGTIRPEGVVLQPDGLGLVAFGDERADVLGVLVPLLGDPDRQQTRTYSSVCRSDTVWWGWDHVSGDTFVLEFDPGSDELVGWNVVNSGPDPTPLFTILTAEGLVAGDSLERARELYPGAQERGSTGSQRQLLTPGGLVLVSEQGSRGVEPYVEEMLAGGLPCAVD